MPHHVVALALPGVVAFDLATVGQVFGHADEDEYTFAVATPDGRSVRTSTGFALADVGDLTEVDRAQTVVIPGFRPRDRPGEATLAALRAAHARGARVASVCTGAFALAATGLLDGLTATTHWQDADELHRRHPAVRVQPDVLYVDHGSLATSAGVAAGIDLCLHLVRRDHGDHVAQRIARRMVVPPHRSGGQAPYVDHPPPPQAHALGAVTEWVLRHLAEPHTVATLARRAHLSERHLARRFVAETGQTPLQWILHQRVLAARRLLETTDLPLAVVAERTGLGTATNLRRHFRRALGTTPSDYRATFGASDQTSRLPGTSTRSSGA